MALTDYDKDKKKGNRIFGGFGKGGNGGRSPVKPVKSAQGESKISLKNPGGVKPVKQAKPDKPVKEKNNRNAGERKDGKSSVAPRASGLVAWLAKPLYLLGGALCSVFFFLGFGVLLVHGYNFFVSSQYFSIKTIEISGNYRLNSREVLDIVKIAPGKNALAVSMDVMEADLARNPWVSGLSIKRTLPDRFDIRITEREPKYWVNRGGILYYADEWGAPIMPVTAGGFSSLPALEIESGAERLAKRLPELVESLAVADLPLDISTSAWLRLSAGGWLELKATESLRIVVGLDGWEGNLRNLGRVLDDLSRRGELRSTAEIRAHGKNVWVTAKPGGRMM